MNHPILVGLVPPFYRKKKKNHPILQTNLFFWSTYFKTNHKNKKCNPFLVGLDKSGKAQIQFGLTQAQ